MATINVVRAPGLDTSWRLEGEDVDTTEKTYPTQQQAIDAARDLLARWGGGELIVQDEEGSVRAKDDVPAAEPESADGKTLHES